MRLFGNFLAHRGYVRFRQKDGDADLVFLVIGAVADHGLAILHCNFSVQTQCAHVCVKR